MKILMLGFEFAPIKSGGLGVACRGIAEGLSGNDLEILFVMPAYINENDQEFGKIKLLSKRNVQLRRIKVKAGFIEGVYGQNFVQDKTIGEVVKEAGKHKSSKQIYGANFWQELERFTWEAIEIAKENEHDLIHAHDWMTYKAGEELKKLTGNPLIVHVHATELDRTAGHPNPEIFFREKRGFEVANKIIVVSALTKNILVKYYGIVESKIEVVHNAAIVREEERDGRRTFNIPKRDKIVLFLGRVTVQKGPEYFVQMAQRTLEKQKNVKFVIVGHGDMLPKIVDLIVSMGLQEKIICAGFLSGESLERALYSADLYVMPSVSEPFGISALEAVEFGVPVMMSKTSGAAEVIRNSLKVDFWDIDKMANSVLAILKFPVLGKVLVEESQMEIKYLTWHEQARKISQIYKQILQK